MNKDKIITRADVGRQARNRAYPEYRAVVLSNNFVYNSVSNLREEGIWTIFEAVYNGKAIEVKTILSIIHRERYKTPEANKAIIITLAQAIMQFLEMGNRRLNPVYINVLLDNNYIYSEVSNIHEKDGLTIFECKNDGRDIEIETTRKITYYARYL